MRILLVTHRYPPDVGGIEEMSRLLARGLAALGHEIKVHVSVGHPDGPSVDADGPPVLRDPGLRESIRAHRWADVVFHNNICLRQIVSLLYVRRPLVVAIRTHVEGQGLTGRLAATFKKVVLRLATTIAVSEAVASGIDHVDHVIHNGYRDDIFSPVVEPSGSADIVFVGRLVSDKGVDLLLQALARIQAQGEGLRVTIIGDGPERPLLEDLAVKLDLAECVTFAGVKSPSEVARFLAAHRVLVVPSRWTEPFGIVALEGLAMDCLPVVSDGGGLPEAVGSYGIVFRRNDIEDLSRAIRRAVQASAPSEMPGYQEYMAAHSQAAMARRYAEVLVDVARRRSRGSIRATVRGVTQ